MRILNATRSMYEIQVPGVVNAACLASGIQIGLINVAGEFCGFSVGHITAYGNGWHNIDL